MTENPYRSLPAVDDLVADLASGIPRPLLVYIARRAIDRARAVIADGGEPDVRAIAMDLAGDVETERGVEIINASGILLHTNIGRANWSDRAGEAATRAARGFGNLELDVATGKRSRRGSYVSRLIGELTGAEAALVVNNNASGLLLALSALAHNRSVPVSRGELIEIGGSYRLPEVMEASGTRLVEVGTTNRTRADDYRTAVQIHRCGALLKIHPSNFEVSGFTQEASLEELAVIARESDLPLVFDLGSGLIDSSQPWVPGWLSSEPAVRQSLEAGADLVLFSGDKLMGGPQAGLIVGKQEFIDEVRNSPLTRALRVDAVTYAALAATLESYLDGTPEEIPFWRHALADPEALMQRCGRLAKALGATVEQGQSHVGAGSAPGAVIPTPVVRIDGGDALYLDLLTHRPALLARREGGDLIIDLRGVEPDQDDDIVRAVAECRS